ncbi:hypothetical protein ACLKA7_013751 [Drosophila subpalustris]
MQQLQEQQKPTTKLPPAATKFIVKLTISAEAGKTATTIKTTTKQQLHRHCGTHARPVDWKGAGRRGLETESQQSKNQTSSSETTNCPQ